MISLLHDHALRIFRTTDVLTLSGLKRPAATHALRRLAHRRLISRLKRGVWSNGLVADLDPLEAVPHLTAPWPSYVSLYTTLSRAGIVEEVPHKIFAVSAGRPATHRTSLGEFDIHHLPSHLI